ncbi:WD40 repeat domain-containing protein [Tardiphaga robiniae]|uniref:WD40 repeat domain-containing protein n=1 Tax=Tardiphaga robiniae TaxID=943830 RepID=UPI001112BE87|nr:hypothetical protein [Tardiphaga robiniae]
MTSIELLDGEPVATLGDGRIVFLGQRRTVEAHAGAILCAAPATEESGLLSGGDDGRLRLTRQDGTETLFQGSKWIDAVASRRAGAYAFAHGRVLTIVEATGARRSLQMMGSVHAIVATELGCAVAHRDGVTLVGAVEDAILTEEFLPSVGGHVAISASPDGRFLVTAALDSSLNCWRLSDRAPSKMGGYSAKPNSMAWADGGKWLATSGETRLIVWPMSARGGLGGKAPVMLAPSRSLVSTVACHPSADLIAAGYRDGSVVLARRKVRIVRPVRGPTNDEITALRFDAEGERLIYGSAGGAVGSAHLRNML